MPSTILSDNGVTSGTSGIKTTGSNDGTLALQTTTAGGAATTALTIDTSQRAAFVAGTAALPAITTTGDTNTGIWFPAADTIAFTEGGTESMRINSAGAVLVNTTSQTGSTRMVVADATGNGQIRAIHSTGLGLNINQASASGDVFIQQQDNAALGFTTNNSERMRIDSSGNVGIGTTSPTQKLTVAGSSSLGTASASGNTQIFQAPGSLYLTLNTNGTLSGARRNWAISPEYDVAGGLSFSVGASEGAVPSSPRLIIKQQGAVILSGGSTSADGVGITFPATQSASSNANTLDDYEEGTWTPTVGGTATYTTQQGQYVKIGNVVTIYGKVVVNSIGTSSGNIISGLPFSSGYECAIPVDKSQSLTTSITWMALRTAGADLYAVTRTAASTSGNINATYLGSGTEIQFAGTYII